MLPPRPVCCCCCCPVASFDGRADTLSALAHASPPADLECRLLLSIDREKEVEDAFATVELAAQLMDQGVVGVALTGGLGWASEAAMVVAKGACQVWVCAQPEGKGGVGVAWCSKEGCSAVLALPWWAAHLEPMGGHHGSDPLCCHPRASPLQCAGPLLRHAHPSFLCCPPVPQATPQWANGRSCGQQWMRRGSAVSRCRLRRR